MGRMESGRYFVQCGSSRRNGTWTTDSRYDDLDVAKTVADNLVKMWARRVRITDDNERIYYRNEPEELYANRNDTKRNAKRERERRKALDAS